MPSSNELIAELRRTLGKMELVLGTIDDAIVWTDESGAIQWCNSAFDKMSGRPHLDMLGASFGDVFPLERRGNRVASVRQFLPDGKGEKVCYERQGLSGRTTLEVSAAASPLSTEPGLVLVIRDVTERKRIEAEVANKNRELEALLHVTSHDLREPLRAVENFSTIVAQDYAERLDDHGKDLLRRIGLAGARMRRLLEDISSLAKARKIVPPSEEVEAGIMIAEVLARLEGVIEKNRASVRVSEDLPRLRVNKLWATQALYNLMSNALKFAKPGQAPDVVIRPYRATGVVLGIIVGDRGPGVRPEDAERIFGLFERGVGREVEGTGAGLAIVRAVAERHGGRTWVRAREGGGSEFIITFGGVL
ncbi:MAG: PAS domain S-box protein [Elusimicrobia bacterium]|nr:PAS domain S-box protein [Elusimicrobiota bacterium]